MPDLNRLPTAIGVRTGATQLLQGLDYFGLLPSNAPQWIIADQNGNALVTPDSVVDLSYKGEQRVGSAPVEQGSFSSYNKIALPQDLTLRLSCAGKNMSRSAFLIALRSLNTSLDRVNVVTPDFVYPSYNIDRVDYKRTSTNGVSMIVAEVHFTEIRVDAYASYTDTAQPSGADSQSQGQVNTAATPTPELPGSTNRQTPLQQAVVSATSAYDAVNQNVNKITSTISNEMTQVMSGVRATLNTAGVGAFT